MADTKSLDRIKMLRREAASLRGATANWRAKYGDRKQYDKQGFGFTLRTDGGLNAFTIALGFEAYTGTYGSSSVGRSWSVDHTLINTFLPKALNQHKQAIFDTMAELAEAEAAELVDKAEAELAALQAMLTDARTPPLCEEAA